MPKRSPERQAELDKFLVLNLAAIDYAGQKDLGKIVYDGVDPMVEIYEWMRNQVRKYHHEGKLGWLQKRISQKVNIAATFTDLQFAFYLKEKTGFEIPVFEDLIKTGEMILQQKKIGSEEQFRTASAYLRLLEANKSNPDKIEVLKDLISEYLDTRWPEQKPKSGKTVVKEYEEDGMIIQEVSFSTGGRKGDFDSGLIKSPDKSKNITLHRSKSKHRNYTSIHIITRDASGGIFQANVFDERISASWMDNHTILIRTSGEFDTPVRVREVKIWGEQINIKYEEL